MEIYEHENEMSDEEMEWEKNLTRESFLGLHLKFLPPLKKSKHGRSTGLVYYLVTTHGGKGKISRCKIICEKTSDDHESERLKITYASSKCNDDSLKCPIQYRLIHCKLLNVWWLQELESWWRGPGGTDPLPVHNNMHPEAIDKMPAMHTKYKDMLNSMYDEDPRRPKQLVNLLATKSVLV